MKDEANQVMPLPRELTRAEYLATFVHPMRLVDESGAPFDLRAYAEATFFKLGIAVSTVNTEIPAVYASADNRYEHVLVFYGAANQYVVFVIDRSQGAVAGYYQLDLGAEYGLKGSRGAEPGE